MLDLIWPTAFKWHSVRNLYRWLEPMKSNRTQSGHKDHNTTERTKSYNLNCSNTTDYYNQSLVIKSRNKRNGERSREGLQAYTHTCLPFLYQVQNYKICFKFFFFFLLENSPLMKFADFEGRILIFRQTERERDKEH